MPVGWVLDLASLSCPRWKWERPSQGGQETLTGPIVGVQMVFEWLVPMTTCPAFDLYYGDGSFPNDHHPLVLRASSAVLNTFPEATRAPELLARPPAVIFQRGVQSCFEF